MVHHLFLGLGLVLVSLANVSCKCVRPSVLIVSFDGFRHDYISKQNTPNLLKLRKKGTYADHMKNVFPTKTFPNHHSMATGVYPEVHGVLGNHLYDPKQNKSLKYDDLWNYNKDVIPLWILNDGVEECHSGSMMWPGSDQMYQKKKPKHVKWNSTVPWRDRVDIFINWLADPTSSVNLVMAYFEEPDYKSHKYGPSSDMVVEQIKNVDNISQYIHDQLVSHNLSNVNVFLLSDHGMDSVNKTKIIKVGEAIEDKLITIKSSPLFYIWPKKAGDKNEEESIYNTLKKESDQSKKFMVYRRKDIPEEWHVKNNDRTPPILVLAKEGYALQDLLSWKVPNFTVDNMTWGVHGYDNKNEKMWPFFMSWGPQIKVDHKVPPFKMLDLYSLWSEMLHVKSPPNNGSLVAVREILLHTGEEPMSATGAIGICVLVTGIIVVGLLIAFFVRRADKSKNRGANEFDPEMARPEGNPLLNKASLEPTSQIV